MKTSNTKLNKCEGQPHVYFLAGLPCFFLNSNLVLTLHINLLHLISTYSTNLELNPKYPKPNTEYAISAGKEISIRSMQVHKCFTRANLCNYPFFL